jgi:uncharacterized membrane protein YidH (DUF202 family)
MSLAVTLVLLLLAVGVGGLANWRERQPQELGRPPLVSYTTVQMIAVVVALLMAAHLVSLATGHQLVSRYFH